MPPNFETLQLELTNDYERLIQVFQQRSQVAAGQEDMIPPPEFIREYLVRPSGDDSKLTQLDMLKNNSIDIFYNLLMV
jgi:hypothetical protein